jgi:molybdenum cofactor guanylyltransferase
MQGRPLTLFAFVEMKCSRLRVGTQESGATVGLGTIDLDASGTIVRGYRATMELSAAVLTGGRSRRMGTDKALLSFRGQPMLKRVLQVLEAISDDVRIVGDRPDYHQFGVPVVADLYADAGALGGIATAIESANHDRVLVVACDMPFLSLPLLNAMIAIGDAYDVLVPTTAGDRSQQGGDVTYETLHAIYARSCLAPIRASLERGQRRVVGFFPEVNVRALSEPWLREYDPALRSFLNTNSPEDVALASSLDEGGQGHIEGAGS